MPTLDEVKNQIKQKLGTIQPEFQNETQPQRFSFLDKVKPFFTRLGKGIEEKTGIRFRKPELGQPLIVLPGKVGQVQEKVARFIAPKTPEEAVLETAINLTPIGIAGKVSRFGKKSIVEGVKKLVSETAKKETLPGNLQRLNVAPEVKETLVNTIKQIKPELESVKGKILSNKEVVEAAKLSNVLARTTSREATLKSEAILLRTRQHLAQLAKDNKITPEFLDTLKVISGEAAKRGRELQALGIKADPQLGDIKTKIIKRLFDIGKTTDEILKASKGIDFTNSEQVTKFYRQFVKPTLPELIDEYRYINLLSSPRTHIVNAFSNLLQVSLLRPATRLASGITDNIASKLTGKEQQFYVKQVPAYYKGAFNALGQATNDALKAIKGQAFIYRPDVARIPTGSKLLRPFVFIPRILEASDVFFRTLARQGEIESLMAKGLTEVQAVKQADEIAAELVFRKALDPANKTGQGALLSGIDKMTTAVYKLRNAPGFKWFIPFVQTPMNILKQGIEYSPAGLATLPKNANKIEQIGKSMIGSLVFSAAGWLALQDRTTWEAPRGEKDRQAFYAAGFQPYSVKVGDTWLAYSRLGPLAYPIAMAAAIKYYTKDSPKSISDTDLQKTSKVLSGIAQFFSDQSYVQGIGDFVSVAQGELGSPTRLLSQVPSQLVPLSSLQRWVAGIIDPIYRKTESGLSVENIINNLKKGIPFLSKQVEPYTTPFGQPSKRQFPVGGAFSPLGITKEDKTTKGLFQLRQEQRRLDEIKKSIKLKIQKQIQERLGNSQLRI